MVFMLEHNSITMEVSASNADTFRLKGTHTPVIVMGFNSVVLTILLLIQNTEEQILWPLTKPLVDFQPGTSHWFSYIRAAAFHTLTKLTKHPGQRANQTLDLPMLLKSFKAQSAIFKRMCQLDLYSVMWRTVVREFG